MLKLTKKQEKEVRLMIKCFESLNIDKPRIEFEIVAPDPDIPRKYWGYLRFCIVGFIDGEERAVDGMFKDMNELCKRWENFFSPN